MKNFNRYFYSHLAIIAVLLSILLYPVTAFAWGDSSPGGKGRPSYTLEEINEGILGEQIIFNTISDADIGDEKNFVSAIALPKNEDGTWETSAAKKTWNGGNIQVEDGKTYLVRIFAHNNSPMGRNAIAENTKVAFNIPDNPVYTTVEIEDENGYVTGETNAYQIQINGLISSSNASPDEYWDYVNFNSETPFYLEYIENSALLYNNKIGKGGYILSNNIIDYNNNGILIGYDALDGRIPGCYEYSSYITIQVKAVCDHEFTLEKKVRLAHGNNQTWKNSIEAKIGDEIEFQIEYTNTDNVEQTDVAIKNNIPKGLTYIKGSARLKNAAFPEGTAIAENTLIDTDIQIGDYQPDEKAYLSFKAKINGNDLTNGSNTIVSWTQANVGSTTNQDYAAVVLYKNAAWFTITIITFRILIAICLIAILILSLYKLRKKRHES